MEVVVVKEKDREYAQSGQEMSMTEFTVADQVATYKEAVTVKWLAPLKKNFISVLGQSERCH